MAWLSEDRIRVQGAPGTAGLGGSLSFYDERVKLFGWTQALNSQHSLEASYKVLIVTKMTQPAPSLRDLSAHALFYSSSLNRPLLVSAKVSISRRGTEGWGSQSQHVKSDACANSHHKLQWTGSFHTIKRVMIILMFRVLQSQHSSKSIIRNPNTIKPSAPHSLYMGLGDTDRPIWNFYRFFLCFFFHSPLTHIYWNDNLLPQNYKHTQKKSHT